MKKYVPLIISLALSLGVGGLSTLLTPDAKTVYAGLEQPPLAPPGWIFPVVWGVLYVLMGVAAWMVWRSRSSGRRAALRLYALQLAVNFVWPLLFFGGRMFWLALADLALLWVLVLAATRAFARIRPAAGRLLLPYLLWITFAFYLNLGVAVLN